MPTRGVDERLAHWKDVAPDADKAGLLLGNGASIAIWERFRYVTLYERATAEDIEHPLSEADKRIFEAMRTPNFEAILAALSTARMVGEILGQDTTEIESRYSSIQRSLIEAVRSVHIPWEFIPDEKLQKISGALKDYDSVYTTNYDLLVYWAIMSVGGEGFKDYLWGGRFNIENTEIWDNSTKVYFLHGALHLYQFDWGQTLKRTAEPFKNLLELFSIPHAEGAVPLFITEGTAQQKLTAIYQSDYLSFCFRNFSEHEGPMVVFGHSLSQNDKHLVRAMRGWQSPIIAVSVLPGKPEGVVALKATIQECLPDAQLRFFDATTHPLGDPGLRIDPNYRPPILRPVTNPHAGAG